MRVSHVRWQLLAGEKDKDSNTKRLYHLAVKIPRWLPTISIAKVTHKPKLSAKPISEETPTSTHKRENHLYIGALNDIYEAAGGRYSAHIAHSANDHFLRAHRWCSDKVEFIAPLPNLGGKIA